jgi:class 3 adenylate cyclase/pimeloyl-ACP methyl ester carboxylesterase
MDAPTIRYAKTSDGVSIAYYAIGGGQAGVYMPAIPFRHIQRQWEIMPQDRQIAELVVSRGRRLVQFDPRGMGSSSHVETFNLEGFVADLEAVVDALDLESFDLTAVTYSTPVAMSYAARHPERLSRLVLIGPFSHGSTALDTPIGSALRAIRGQDWEIYTRTVMQIIVGWEQTDGARQMSTILREAIRPEDLLKIMDTVESFDVADLLAQVRVQTLVVHLSASQLIPVEHSRAVAAGIPGAEFAAASAGEELLVVGRYLGLLGDAPPAADTQTAAPAATAIILFADIADSTALTERLGDAAFREKARALDESLRRAISSNGGQAIDGKLLGDGVLATFGAAREAIACAQACHAAGSHAGLPLHIGVHAGDVIREENNVFGGAVNIAARVAGEAAAGETLVSQTVRELARTSAGVSFEDRGERALKGVGEPVRLFAVREG